MEWSVLIFVSMEKYWLLVQPLLESNNRSHILYQLGLTQSMGVQLTNIPDPNAIKQRCTYPVLTQEDIHPANAFHTMFMPSRRPSLLIFPHVQSFKMPLEHVRRCVSAPLRSRPLSYAARPPLVLHTELPNRSKCCGVNGKIGNNSV